MTDWCVHPRDGVAALPKVGGTKTPDLAAIRALVSAPDPEAAADAFRAAWGRDG